MLNIRRITKNALIYQTAAYAAAFAAGFTLSDTNIAGISSFADISATGALGLPGAAAIFTGSLIHSILSADVGKNIIKISSMLMIIIFKMFCDTEDSPKISGAVTAVSIFLSGAAVTAVIGDIFYKLLFYAFYAAAAGAAAYALSVIVSGLKNDLVLDLSSVSGCAYAMIYTIMVSALCSVKFPVVNLGLIASVTFTLFGAHRYKCSGGVLCGALSTCGAFLSSQECGMAIVLLPVAGLMTGYLSRRKYTTAALFFLGVNFILIVLTGVSLDSIYTMLDIIIGTALFTVLSPYFSDRWIITDRELVSAVPEIMDKRMKFLSDSIETVRNESAKIADMLTEEICSSRDFSVCSRKVCTDCCRRLVCWKNESDRTVRGFRRLAVMSEISEENFPYELKECIHKEELAEVFEKTTREKAMAKLLEMRFSDSRRLLFEQIKIMEEIISAAGERINVRYSSSISRVVREKLKKFGIVPQNVIAYYNSTGRLLIELYFPYTETPESVTRICDLVSDELRVPLSSTEPVSAGREIRIRLFERPQNSLEVCTASLSADGNEESGDTSLVFGDGTGISYIILSDGMGSGRKASIESRLVVRMFKRLISSGVEHNSAIKLINSIMLTKSGEESFATLDAVRADLDDRSITIMKSGASATLIRHRGTVMKISSSSFPIGIYERSEIYTHDLQCDEGDIIIMLSDGISENEYRFIKELLLESDDLKHIVDEICAKSQIFNSASRSDDITVIGIRFCVSKR